MNERTKTVMGFPFQLGIRVYYWSKLPGIVGRPDQTQKALEVFTWHANRTVFNEQIVFCSIPDKPITSVHHRTLTVLFFRESGTVSFREMEDTNSESMYIHFQFLILSGKLKSNNVP